MFHQTSETHRDQIGATLHSSTINKIGNKKEMKGGDKITSFKYKFRAPEGLNVT